eukprot:TRINITY_DN2406_c0_g2_i1.p5 TRINITY_DN2406_c0_g2~~TRINITY_DN2406_c0_g2_i1.p5  ORF type:complete len:103 (+),score=14.22 TRINITY_DN2406_c0_g2_i1:987-1295(+)
MPVVTTHVTCVSASIVMGYTDGSIAAGAALRARAAQRPMPPALCTGIAAMCSAAPPPLLASASRHHRSAGAQYKSGYARIQTAAPTPPRRRAPRAVDPAHHW